MQTWLSTSYTICTTLPLLYINPPTHFSYALHSHKGCPQRLGHTTHMECAMASGLRVFWFSSISPICRVAGRGGRGRRGQGFGVQNPGFRVYNTGSRVFCFSSLSPMCKDVGQSGGIPMHDTQDQLGGIAGMRGTI